MKKSVLFILSLFVLLAGCRVQSAAEKELTTDLIVPVRSLVEELSAESETVQTCTLKLSFVGDEPVHKDFNQEISGTLDELMVSEEKFYIPDVPFGTTLQIKLQVFVSSDAAQNKLLYEGISEKITISSEFTNIKILMKKVKESASGTDGGNTGGGDSEPAALPDSLMVSVWARDSADSANGSFAVVDAFGDNLTSVGLTSVPSYEMPDDFVSDGKENGNDYFGYYVADETDKTVVRGFEIYRYKSGNYSSSSKIWGVTTANVNYSYETVNYYDMQYDSENNVIYVMVSYTDKNTYIYKLEAPDTMPGIGDKTFSDSINAATTTITGVTGQQFAVYDGKVYLLYEDELAQCIRVNRYDTDGISDVTPFDLAGTQNVSDGYLQYGNLSCLSFPDLAVNEKGVFVLAREVSSALSTTAGKVNYSRGALIKLELDGTEFDPSMIGWTEDISSAGSVTAYWPVADGTGFWGPLRILGLEGNALVFADDGACYNAGLVQKNSIVIVNLSNMSFVTKAFASDSPVEFDKTITAQ